MDADDDGRVTYHEFAKYFLGRGWPMVHWYTGTLRANSQVEVSLERVARQ